MKLHFLAIPALFAASIAGAQNAPAAPAPAQAPAKLTIDAPIEQLMADPKAKAVVDTHLPNVESHPAYGQFKGMSLKAVQPLSGGMITDELLAKIAAGLAAI